MKSGATLRVGQAIKLPHQAFLEAGREAKNKILALDYYIQTHGGRLPPNLAHPPSISEQVGDQARWQHIDKTAIGSRSTRFHEFGRSLELSPRTLLKVDRAQRNWVQEA